MTMMMMMRVTRIMMISSDKCNVSTAQNDNDDNDIPTSHIPTRWESVVMIKGGNMTQQKIAK